MPYLTPQDLPEDDDCRPLFIPASTEWLALFAGALTELTKRYNWEDSGGLSIDDTLDEVNAILDLWYAGCTDCELPEGGSLIRIGIDGHPQQLIDGEWAEPTGDYEIPAVPEREGGTSVDQTCLAAKNAANVLQLLYENLSDSFGAELDAAEALTAVIATVVEIIGIWAGGITFAIGQTALAAFAILYQLLEFVIADLWTPDFTTQLECILVGCATNDAGVVTFDWDCFQNALLSDTNDYSLTGEQLRLYLQILAILGFIGGVDALNQAGATTAITEGECACGYCYHFDFSEDDYGDLGWAPFDVYGQYISTQGYERTIGNGLILQATLPTSVTVTRIDFGGTAFFNGSPNGRDAYWRLGGSNLHHNNVSGMSNPYTYSEEWIDFCDEIWLNPYNGTASINDVYITEATIYTQEQIPEWIEHLCE